MSLSWLSSFIALLALGDLSTFSEARAFFVFGDSLVDNSNNNYLATTARADSPPYGIDHPTHRATGRFSNGLNIPDIISEHIGAHEPTLPYLSPELTGERLRVGANFASAGIGILNDTGIQFINIIRITKQLHYFEQYQQRLSSLIGPGEATRLVNKALVLITLGGNDFVNNYYLVPFSARSREFSLPDYVRYLISEYKKILARLYNLGARRVLVTGPGPLGCVPSELAQRSRTGDCYPELMRAADLFNPQLVQIINELNSEAGSDVFIAANAFQSHMDFITNPQAYGFVTAKVACCGQGPYNGIGLCTVVSNLCSNRDEYAFWDPFHPTEKANRIIVSMIMTGSTDYIYPMNLRRPPAERRRRKEEGEEESSPAMSSIYVSEPPTKGKVVVSTTMGPLDIELWPKEAPKAARNFVQLCLEGYYDRTIFHRAIKSFLVQGGDPTASGNGGESIYGGVFADEFHSRLRFNHRGLLACANAGSPHSNGSQFFITLDRCDWLDRKNTIFGKVTGDSIFNLLRLGDVETDKDDRPLDPPKILSVEVLWNPFDDIVPRRVAEKPASQTKLDASKTDQKQKAVKKLNVLSFGEEVEEDEKEAANVNDKIKSIHDVLDDPRFIKEEAQKDEVLSSAEVERRKDIQMSVREALHSKKVGSSKDHEISSPGANDHSDDDDDDEEEAKFDARMRLQILKKRNELGDIGTREKISNNKVRRKDQRVQSPRSNDKDTENQASKIDKLSIKKKGIGSEAMAERMAKADTDLQLLSHADQERQLKKLKKRRLHGREDDTLAKLERFKSSISKKLVAPSGSDSKANDGEDDSGWMTNRLAFIPESSGKDNMARNDDPNEYVVHDPLLEKGKEKFNKMQAKLKQREREWAGKSLT